MSATGQERKPIIILSCSPRRVLKATSLCGQSPLMGALPCTSSFYISLLKLRTPLRLLFTTVFSSSPPSAKFGSLFCSKGGCLGLRDVDAGLSSRHSSQV